MGDEQIVKCPACGYEYSQIREVYTRVGSDPYESIIYKGTTVIEGPGATTGNRRSCLVIVFDGECGHSWEWQIQQHKGINYFTAARP